MNVSLLASPQFYSRTLYVVGCISIPIHIFAGYCILFQTPVSMKSVKWNLLNLYFWSTFMDIFLNIITQPFLTPPSISGFLMGLIHYTGLDTGIVLYFGITMMAFVGVSIVSIFENRYFILCGQNTWWRRVRYPFLIVNYLLASVHYIPTLIEIPDQIAGREGMFTMYPKARVFDNPENPIYVISYEKNDWYAIREASIILMFTAEVTGFVIPVQIYMRRAVKKFNLSEHSISIQKTFLRALHLQIAIPALIMLLPHVATAILGIFVSTSQATMNISYIVISMHGVFANLTMMYVHKPYREYCKSRVCFSSRVDRFVSSTGLFSTHT
ncbi:hypothetical protein CRE_05026 [Caenorhabditis remanei]|uniref:Serpentine Receptor, class H n=1 Tax=Caenorhabditis remanei TaxID=31234 RepID=E3MZ33_CAERE|nr:hypothetical protein CRE_05026 [Caenorhabditis remanei]